MILGNIISAVGGVASAIPVIPALIPPPPSPSQAAPQPDVAPPPSIPVVPPLATDAPPTGSDGSPSADGGNGGAGYVPAPLPTVPRASLPLPDPVEKQAPDALAAARRAAQENVDRERLLAMIEEIGKGPSSPAIDLVKRGAPERDGISADARSGYRESAGLARNAPSDRNQQLPAAM